MKSYARSTPPVGLLTIGASFLILVSLLIVFSRELFSNISELTLSAGVIAIVAALALPAFLLGMIVWQAVRLLRDRARRRPGSLLKSRFILFITALVLLATLPLEVISYNFIDLASSFWLSAGIEESIGGATRLALDYYDTTVENLQSFTGSSLLGSFLAARGRGMEEQWLAISSANSSIDFIQVFDERGAELSFVVSDPALRREVRLASLDELRRQPELAKTVRPSLSFIRARITRSVDGRQYTVAVGTLLSPGFAQTSNRLSAAAGILRQLDVFSRRIALAVLFVYVLFSLPVLLLCLLVSFYLADELVLPIMSLEDAIRRVAQGDFSFRILVRSRDELSVLVNSFNRMVTELADSRQKLRQAEKIAAWKEIARRLAHELRNPLTPIKLQAQRILRRAAGETGAEVEKIASGAAQAIIREVDTLDALLREFSEFARLPEPQRVSVHIAELAEQAVAAYSPAAPAVRFDLSGLPRDLVLQADLDQIRRVFSNLLRNAVRAMPEGGTVTILADVVSKGETSYCRLQLRDSGVGMDDETRRQAFLPYFTTYKEGTGLGLAIVERIVFDHNGQIWIESHRGVGTTVFIDLPLG